MNSASYIKLWNSGTSVNDEVQTFDLLSYEYKLEKPASVNGQVTGQTQGGNVVCMISGFPASTLLKWMFDGYLLKDAEIFHSLTGTRINVKEAKCSDFKLQVNKRKNQVIFHLSAMVLDFGDSCFSRP